VYIESKVEAKSIDIGGKTVVKGGRIEEVDVGGSFESEDSFEFSSIDVGGAVTLTGKNVGGDIDVGGSCKVDGDLKFGRINVGGIIEISGSAEGESLDVGGTVRIGTSLRLLGSLEVGGKVEVKEELSAKEIDVGGSLEAKKVTVEDKVSVGGSIITTDGVHARYVEIGRRGKVDGPIYADEVLIRERATVVDIHAKLIEMERKAQARNLYGERIRLESGCQISGEILYRESLESEDGVKFAKPPEKVEKLP
jgi:cytoskeletal protein CcmA (bactofilin family)